MIDIISRLQSITQDTGSLEDIRSELERGARLEARGERVSVSFVIGFESVEGGSPRGRRRRGDGAPGPGSVTLYQHGYRPSRVLAVVEESGSLHQALTALANEKPGVSGAHGVTRVEMLLFPTPSRAG